MENEYLMYGIETHEFVDLGPYFGDGLANFLGPIVRLNGKAYTLPSRLLNLLVDRFMKANSSKGVVIGKVDLIFENNPYLDDPEELVPEIGGERYSDPPLSKYLPEIDDPEIREEIIRHGEYGP